MHVVLMQKLHLIPRARNVYNCICVYLSPIKAVQTQTHGAAASRAPQWHDAVKGFRGGEERQAEVHEPQRRQRDEVSIREGGELEQHSTRKWSATAAVRNGQAEKPTVR